MDTGVDSLALSLGHSKLLLVSCEKAGGLGVYVHSLCLRLLLRFEYSMLHLGRHTASSRRLRETVSSTTLHATSPKSQAQHTIFMNALMERPTSLCCLPMSGGAHVHTAFLDLTGLNMIIPGHRQSKLSHGIKTSRPLTELSLSTQLIGEHKLIMIN